jgi:sterol desaturase/sphingolipid hydroxylase (fatty acid hydroxylase superfamily)
MDTTRRSPLLAPSAVELGLLMLSGAALGLAACVRMPGALTSPEVRGLYPASLPRDALHVLASASLAAWAVAVLGGHVRRRTATLGAALVAIAVSFAAGPAAARTRAGEGLISLDWLVLDTLVVGLLVIPLERGVALRRSVLLRPEWGTDLRYFVVNHLGLHGVGTLAVLISSGALARERRVDGTSMLAGLPLLMQVLLLLVAADLVQYALHRAMHEVPWLWRIHAIHHSSEHMDALAGSRIHIAETLLTRTAVYAAIAALEPRFEAFLGYAAVIAFQGTFIHVNSRLRYGWLEHFVVSPRFHHWHHASDRAAIDTNYAGTFPWIDRLFGTHHLPAENAWPQRYGVLREVVPPGLLAQQWFPFRAGGCNHDAR